MLGEIMKRYEAPVVLATYETKDLRAEASLVAVASIHLPGKPD
jgi:hypothetical protein